MDRRKPIVQPLVTPDGRYLVVKGRLWRTTNPSLSAARRAALTKELMAARRAVAKAFKTSDGRLLKRARAAVDSAKVRLGERGRVWWSDGAPDYNRYLAKNTPYDAWYARRTKGQADAFMTGGESSAKSRGKGSHAEELHLFLD